MSLATVTSRALDALDAPEVHVEVQLANGLPSFMLVGLADTEVKESRERVRAALQQSGFAFPHNKRITVNLAPADLPKESGRFDLPIAWASWLRPACWTQPAWRRTNSPASCRWPASCARCVARWRWAWRCDGPAAAGRWCCQPRAPARPRRSPASTCAAPAT